MNVRIHQSTATVRHSHSVLLHYFSNLLSRTSVLKRLKMCHEFRNVRFHLEKLQSESVAAYLNMTGSVSVL